MALTKAGSEVDAIQEVAQNAVVEGSPVTVSDAYSMVLGIKVAITSDVAHDGTKIVPQYSTNASGDEDWVDMQPFVTDIAAAADIESEACTDNPLTATSTTGNVAATTGFDADGSREIFIEDITTFANGEFLRLVSHVANTSVTWLDGTARAHAVNSLFWNVARTYEVRVHPDALRVRVLYDNTYDSDGATVAIHCRIVERTGV